MIKFIELSRGHYAIVDKKHFGWMQTWKWSFGSHNYAVRTDHKHKRGVLMHRQLMRAKPGQHVDHIDGDTTNNLATNLRLCTVHQNLCNRKINANNTTGFKGVHLLKSTGRFHAQIKYDKTIRVHIGYFATAVEAAKAYDVAAKKYHGEFARLNFPEE